MNAARFSPCRTWRYSLARDTGVLDGAGNVVFIGLNPSTADETRDDPTIRRCVGFARAWGFKSLTMLNVYALRSTNPAGLWEVDDPVGPENNAILAHHVVTAQAVVAAWGVHARPGRVQEVLRLCPSPVVCLGMTKAGAPRHPLYVRRDAPLDIYYDRGA